MSDLAAAILPSAWPPHPACNFLTGFEVARKCLLLSCLIVTLKEGVRSVGSETVDEIPLVRSARDNSNQRERCWSLVTQGKAAEVLGGGSAN